MRRSKSCPSLINLYPYSLKIYLMNGEMINVKIPNENITVQWLKDYINRIKPEIPIYNINLFIQNCENKIKNSDIVKWHGIKSMFLLINISDREIITNFYNSMNGANWNNFSNANWLSDKSLNEWNGISTSIIDDNERVITISLPYCELEGQISYDFGLLSELRGLELNNNKIIGKIPDSFSNLSKLKILNLKYNLLDYQVNDENSGSLLVINKLKNNGNLKFALLSNNL